MRYSSLFCAVSRYLAQISMKWLEDLPVLISRSFFYCPTSLGVFSTDSIQLLTKSTVFRRVINAIKSILFFFIYVASLKFLPGGQPSNVVAHIGFRQGGYLLSNSTRSENHYSTCCSLFSVWNGTGENSQSTNHKPVCLWNLLFMYQN